MSAHPTRNGRLEPIGSRSMASRAASWACPPHLHPSMQEHARSLIVRQVCWRHPGRVRSLTSHRAVRGMAAAAFVHHGRCFSQPLARSCSARSLGTASMTPAWSGPCPSPWDHAAQGGWAAAGRDRHPGLKAGLKPLSQVVAGHFRESNHGVVPQGRGCRSNTSHGRSTHGLPPTPPSAPYQLPFPTRVAPLPPPSQWNHSS
jgi:hypothetical protein